MSGCTASSAPAPSSITTSSCSPASPAGWSTPSRSPRSATAARGLTASIELWAALTDRYGRSDAARQMVDVLLLCREHGPASVELAVRGALTAGAIDGRAVAVLARRARAPRAPPGRSPRPRLAAHDRPAPDDLADYDQLHDRGRTMIGPDRTARWKRSSSRPADWTGDAARQLVTVMMTDGTMGLTARSCALLRAEHAEQLTRHRQGAMSTPPATRRPPRWKR